MKGLLTEIAGRLEYALTCHADRPKYHMTLKFVDSKENILHETAFSIYANNPVKKIWEKVNKLRDKGGYRKLSIVSIHKEENSDKVSVSLKY